MALIRLNRQPTSRDLLGFALGCVVFGAGLAAREWLRGRHLTAEIVAAIGGLVPVLWLIYREPVRWLYIGLCHVTYPLGYVVSGAVLAIFFYGVVTPLGVLVRCFRREPLGGSAGADGRSYWQRRDRPRDPASYLKQY